MADYTDVLRQQPQYMQGLRALNGYTPPEPLQEDTSGILSSIGSTALSGLGVLGNVLDTPGAFVRALLKGEVGRAFGGIFDTEQRVTGKELTGISDDPDSWMDDIGGIGAEIVTDPLFWLKPLTAGGAVARSAGVTPEAIRTVGTGALEIGKRQRMATSSLRSIAGESAEAADAIRKAAQGTKPGLLSKLMGYNHWGGNSYGDDLLKQVDEGLQAAPGMGGIVDEPLRRALGSVNIYGQKTFESPLESGIKKWTGQSTPELAGSIDRAWERVRYGNWLDAVPDSVKQKLGVGAAQATTPLTAAQDTGVLSPNGLSIVRTERLGPVDSGLRFMERDLPGQLDQSVMPKTIDFNSDLDALKKFLPTDPNDPLLDQRLWDKLPPNRGDALDLMAKRAVQELPTHMQSDLPESIRGNFPLMDDIPAVPVQRGLPPELAADPLAQIGQTEVSPLVRGSGSKEYSQMIGEGPLPAGVRELPSELPPERIGFARELLNKGDGSPKGLFFNPIESVARLIEKGTRGAATPEGRSVSRTALAREEAALEGVRGEMAPMFMEYLDKIPETQLADPAFTDEMTDFLESAGKLTGSLTPETQKILSDATKTYESQITKMKEAGVNITELDDGISYAARRLLELPDANYTKAYEGAGRFVSPITPNQAGRDPIFKGDLTSKFNKMSRDRRIANNGDLGGKADQRVGIVLDEYKYQNFDRKAYEADRTVLKNLQKSKNATPDEITKAAAKVEAHEAKIANAKKLVKWFQDNAQGQYADFAEKQGKPYGMFSSNPVKNLENYVGHSTRATSAADTLVEGLLPHVLQKPSKYTMPLTEALSDVGLGKGGQGTERALQRVMEGLGFPASAPPQQFHVPKQIAQDFSRIIKSFSGPEEASSLVKGLDKFTNFFKVFALMRPAFHGRNLGGGLIQNKMHLNSSIKGYGEMKSLVNGGVIEGAGKWPAFAGKNLDDAAATREIRKLMYQYDVVPKHVGLADDVAGQWDFDVAGNIPGGRGGDVSFNPVKWAKQFKAMPGSWNPLKIKGLMGKDTEFKLAKAHEMTGNVSEQMNRGVPFLEGLKQGISPQQLAKDIREAHVDYKNLSETERQVFRRLFPFWTYTKGMTTFTAKKLAENPAGPLGQVLRGMRVLRGNEILPEHLAETAAIPLGRNDEGDPRYITGFGLMPEDSLMLLGNALGAVGADKKGLGFQVGGMVNPLLKYPIESVLGRSMFQGGPGGGRELRDMDPVLGRIFSNVVGGEPPRTNALDNLLMNTIPTPLTTAKQITDTRKGIIPKAANLLTGVKITDVPQKVQEAMIRQETQELMRELGGREYSQYFIPDEAYDKLSPESQRRADALKGIVKELQTRAKSRAAEKKKQVQ